MRYIITGRQELKKELFSSNMSNSGLNKPAGGLWSSPHWEGKTFVSEWHEWSYYNMGLNMHGVGVIFEVAPDARIYEIDSVQDLEQLINRYPGESIIMSIPMLDYAAVAKDYDAIFLTRNGEEMTRFSTPSLYGWDVESLLILNFDIITNCQKIEY